MMKEVKGFLLALLSGATFGLIPLFAIPVIEDGMDYTDIIFFRFGLGSLGMLAMMLFRQMSLKISLRDICRISVLSMLYVICAITLFMSYQYIPSGVSTALIYTNPIWCALITLLFLGGKMSWRLASSLMLSVVGVSMLSGLCSGELEKIMVSSPSLTGEGSGGADTVIGLLLGMTSGIGYGIYLTILPRLQLGKMPATKLNFYIFGESTVLLLLYATIFDNGLSMPHCTNCWMYLTLLGLIPTAFSNICLTMSLHLIDSTIVSILGAFEPFTAMVAGIILLNEPYDVYTITGALLILIAVMLLTIKKQSPHPTLPRGGDKNDGE